VSDDGDVDVGGEGAADVGDDGTPGTNDDVAPDANDQEDPDSGDDGDGDIDLSRRALMLAGAMGFGLFALFAVDDGGPTEPDVSYDADALERVVDLGQPATARTFPVSIGSAFVESRRERAESLLASAPAEPGIPNEAVAREYADRYEHAADALARAEEAQSPYERLDALQSAQWFAADVNAVYAAFASDLTLEDVLARREPIRERLADFRDRWRYLGDGDAPGVALAVHAELESRVSYAAGQLERADGIHRREESRVLRIGSTAGTIELARTAATRAPYLYDRFVEGLDESRRLGGAFDQVARLLVADVRGRCPDPLDDGWTSRYESRYGRDLAFTVAHDLLRDAVQNTRWRCEGASEAREREGAATAALAAGAADRDLRALDRVESAVGRGEYDVPRSVTPVRREKLAAIEAVETAREATPAALSSGWVAIAVDDVQGGDYTLSRALEHARDGGEIEVYEVARAVAEYAWGRARAAATPAALSRLTGALDAATSPDED
jgi:hypothetical protein